MIIKFDDSLLNLVELFWLNNGELKKKALYIFLLNRYRVTIYAIKNLGKFPISWFILSLYRNLFRVRPFFIEISTITLLMLYPYRYYLSTVETYESLGTSHTKFNLLFLDQAPTGKTITIWRKAVRENGLSQHHRGPIKDLLGSSIGPAANV